MIRHFGLAGRGWFVSFSGVGLPDLRLGMGLGLGGCPATVAQVCWLGMGCVILIGVAAMCVFWLTVWLACGVAVSLHNFLVR